MKARTQLSVEKKIQYLKRSPEVRVKDRAPIVGSAAFPSSVSSRSSDRTRFPDLPSRSRTAHKTTVSSSSGSASSKSPSLVKSQSRSRSRKSKRTQSRDVNPFLQVNKSHREELKSDRDSRRTPQTTGARNCTIKARQKSVKVPLTQRKKKLHSSPCLKSPHKKRATSGLGKCRSPIIPGCFPPMKVAAYQELPKLDGESKSANNSRLRRFEAKRQKIHLFKTRCFSDDQLILRRRVSDDFSDISAEEASTINVFSVEHQRTVGADTIRFRSHIKYTCETFDKHMRDQYEGKIIDGKCVYSYWLFYQQVERFKAIGLDILEDALKSNDKQLLRDCIDEMKHEVKLIHTTFLNYDSLLRVHIEDKRVMDEYAIMYERCGRFARLTKGGDIQPHEMIAMWDDIQRYIIDEFLEQVFIDFCFFMQLQFIIPQKESTPLIPNLPDALPDEKSQNEV